MITIRFAKNSNEIRQLRSTKKGHTGQIVPSNTDRHSRAQKRHI